MAAPDEASEDPLAGHERYRTIRVLGQGGMGQVLEAEHALLGTRVVVKLLHEKLATQPALIDRMRLEAQSLARLSHPNLVKVTDFDQTRSGRPFFVMELLKGKSLREEQESRGKVPVLEAITLCRQALAGLAAAHDAGLIHRDIKLDNLFACDPARAGEERIVKVLDFGVAKVRDGSAGAPAPLAVPTSTGVIVGTPRFFSPEQARGTPLDHRADIYAMGLVLYTLLAGRGPFDDAINVTDMARAHVFRKPDPPSKLAGRAVPPELDAAVLRALAKDPEARFPSADAFSRELETILKGLDKRTQPMSAVAGGGAAQASGATPETAPATGIGWAATERITPGEAEALTKAREARQARAAQGAGAQAAGAQPAAAQPAAARPAPPTARSPGVVAPHAGAAARDVPPATAAQLAPPTTRSPGAPVAAAPALAAPQASQPPIPSAPTELAPPRIATPTAPAMPAVPATAPSHAPPTPATVSERTAYMPAVEVPMRASSPPMTVPTEPMRHLRAQAPQTIADEGVTKTASGFSPKLALIIVLVALAAGGLVTLLLLRNM